MRSITVAAAAAALALFGLSGAGCLQTTVKPAERRILTSDEARQAELERRTKEKSERPADAAPERPRTPEAEIERLRAEVEKDPQNPKWHFLLGLAYEQQGKYELAELRYRRGGDLLPKDQYTGPHYVLGRVLTREAKFDAALAALNRAVAVKPPDLEGYYLNPDYRESYYLIGAIQYRLGNVAESEKALRLFLKYGGERSRAIEFFPELVAD